MTEYFNEKRRRSEFSDLFGKLNKKDKKGSVDRHNGEKASKT